MVYTIPWKPHAKQRPRVANGHAYTSKATREAEKKIKEAFFEHAAGHEVIEGPTAVKVVMFNDCFTIEFTPTVEYSNRKLRGDVDNYAKTILDSLNGIAYVDDKQITHLTMEKA